MVTIPPERVADALHTDYSQLPTGYNEDIKTAEHVINTYVEPYSDEADIVESTGVYAAAAFVAGTEGDAPISDVETETASYTIDVSNMSDVARDHWSRAIMLDPTGNLSDISEGGGSPGFTFDSISSRGPPPEERR